MGPGLPRRVLLTADAMGGVWTWAVELARGLAAAGIEVHIAVAGPAPGPDRLAELDGAGVTVAALGGSLEWQDPPGLAATGALAALRAEAERFGADLVHAGGWRDAAAGFAVPVVLGAHSCVATWWEACRGGPLPPDWAAYADGVRAGIAAATATIVPTQAFRAALERTWRPLPQACVIPHGIADDADAGDAGVPGPGPQVLAAGRFWDEAKNLAAVARAAPAIPGVIAVAGPGDEAPSPGIVRLGALPRAELRLTMRRSALFLSPARYEPFGLAALEAAAAGAGLVLGDIPTARELWDGAAAFVEPDDVAALAGVARGLLADPSALAGARAAARERAARFSRARMVAAHLDLYRGLAGTALGAAA